MTPAGAASHAAWHAVQNTSSLGPWFTAAGYYTAFLGKTVNGASDSVPRGWTHWGAFTALGTYAFTSAVQVRAVVERGVRGASSILARPARGPPVMQWDVPFDPSGTEPLVRPQAVSDALVQHIRLPHVSRTILAPLLPFAGEPIRCPPGGFSRRPGRAPR